MPELPEVEIVRRGLQKELVGDAIVHVKVLRKDSIGYPSPGEFAKKVTGHTFNNFGRRGKYLIIQLNSKAQLIVHLRMSGRLLLVKKQVQAAPFLRVRFSLKSKRELRFEDMRVFGRIWYIPPNMSSDEIIPALSTLGTEPVGLTGKTLRELFKDKAQTIKSALMDQRLIAGIGNIYADESLFKARINPLRKAGEIKQDKLERLAETIEVVLSQAIDLGGSSVRNYVDSDGINGNYQHSAWVYGRSGKPCRICGSIITRVKIAGRSSHFCPYCQELSKNAL